MTWPGRPMTRRRAGRALIALLETFWPVYLTIAYKDLAVFALPAIVLALRP